MGIDKRIDYKRIDYVIPTTPVATYRNSLGNRDKASVDAVGRTAPVC